MTYHPFRKSGRFDDPNCDDFGKGMFDPVHDVTLELERLKNLPHPGEDQCNKTDDKTDG